jgi:hypothetical protein
MTEDVLQPVCQLEGIHVAQPTQTQPTLPDMMSKFSERGPQSNSRRSCTFIKDAQQRRL